MSKKFNYVVRHWSALLFTSVYDLKMYGVHLSAPGGTSSPAILFPEDAIGKIIYIAAKRTVVKGSSQHFGDGHRACCESRFSAFAAISAI
ncbi:MAG: hypothetical protein WCE45_00040 [Sedimentisphaerales bacterium]